MRGLVIVSTVVATALLHSGAARTVEAPTPLFPLECSKHNNDQQSYICGSQYLSRLYTLVELDARGLLDQNPMRRTTEEELGLRLGFNIRKAENFNLAGVLATLHREDERAMQAAKSALAARYSDADIHSRCVELSQWSFETLLLTCKVESVEGIAAGIVGQRQAWTGPAEGDYALSSPSAMAILETSGSPHPPETPEIGAYRLVGWTATYATSIGKPFMVEGDGRAYLTIPQTSQGSAGSSGDVVMARIGSTAPWHEIDATSWFQDLDHRIPRGLYSKTGYSLDLLTMRAITDIARDGDPNCCPSGGRAEINLALRDDALVVDGLVLRRTAPALQTAPRARPVHGNTR